MMPPLLTVLMSAGLVSAQSVDSTKGSRCVDFSSQARLHRGAPWSARIAQDLEVRLVPERAATVETSYGWKISVGPQGEPRDFLWLVSPPLQTAPHLIVGAAYGLTAKQSAEIPRKLRFVLTRSEYDEALAVVQGDAPAGQTIAKLERLGRGTLTFTVTNYELRDRIDTPRGPTDGLEWIEFNGRACLPVTPAPGRL